MARVRLHHESRCSTPLTAGQAIAIGALFTAVAVPLLLVAGGVLSAQVRRGVPPWVLAAIAASFGLIGLWLLGSGITGHVRRRRKLRGEQHDAPWFADHDWDPDRIPDDNPRLLLKHVAVAGFMAVFLLPFNWWAFVCDERVLPVQLVVGLFDSIMLLSVGYLVYRALQLVKFGRSHVRLAAFPMRLGETVRLTFGMQRELGTFERLRFRLRFVEEVFEVRGTGRNRSQTVAPYELWSADHEVDVGGLGFGHDEVTVEFALPAHGEDGESGYLTRLSDRPPCYWELEAKLSAWGIDYLARFPLPVYLPVCTSSERRSSRHRTTSPSIVTTS